MNLPESEEVSSERLLRRDHGPDVHIALPREHWILVGALLNQSRDATTDLTADPVIAVLFEMRDFAEYTINEAVKQSIMAELRAEAATDG